ncbi:MAG: cell division protein ZapA [bacterium]|jgi:cell division protein ZapA
MPNAEENSIEVNLLGRSYRVTCGDGEREALMQAAAYLDGKMNEIKNSSKVTGTERIAVMAALNIAYELLSVKIGGGLDVGQVKRRISDIEAKLDAALAQQEKLF